MQAFHVDGDRLAVGARYRPAKCVGVGSTGRVYMALDKRLDRVVAIKKVMGTADTETARRLAREINVMRGLKHPNILHLIDVIAPELRDDNSIQELCLVLPYMPSDMDRILFTSMVSPSRIQYMLYQLLLAVHYIHSCKVVHRDIKPQNVLVEPKTFHIKLCDFGLAKALHRPIVGNQPSAAEAEVVTQAYRAPELMLLGHTENETAVDMWSVGCVCAEAYRSQPLFASESYIGQLRKTVKIIGHPHTSFVERIQPEETQRFILELGHAEPALHHEIPEAPQDLLYLTQQLLQWDPSQRLSAEEALRHPYFASVFKEKHLTASTSETPFTSQVDPFLRTPQSVQDTLYREILHFNPAMIHRVLEQEQQGKKKVYLAGQRRSII